MYVSRSCSPRDNMPNTTLTLPYDSRRQGRITGLQDCHMAFNTLLKNRKINITKTKLPMKTKFQYETRTFRVLFLVLMCLLSLSCVAQVQVEESELLGIWYVEDEMPSAKKPGMDANGKAKGVFTYQPNGVVVCRLDLDMDLILDMPEYKNHLKMDFSMTFQGNWSIKKGNVLVQKMKETEITPIRIVAEHENSDQDKVFLLMMKSMMEEAFLKEAKKMTKAGKEKILSFTAKEMVTNGSVYKRME